MGIKINASFEMSSDEMAEIIVEGIKDPTELLNFLIRCDELVADVDFTQELYARLGYELEQELGT